MKCYAEKYCKKNKAECSEDCTAYVLLRNLYNLSKLPERYKYNIPLVPGKDDLEAFNELNEFMKDIENHVAQGEGLYIWSESTGNGKTSWAAKIMNYYFRKIVFKTGLENEGLYINVPTFLEDLRAYYSNEDDEFTQVLYMARWANLLIMDDIGAEKPSEWVSERLLQIINFREAEGKSTIYTSNISPAELGKKLGNRIKSRIMGNAKEIHLVAADKRGGGR